MSYLYVPASLTRKLFGGVRRPDTVMFLATMPPQGDAVTELGGPFAVHNRPRNQPFPGIESTGRHTGEAASGWSQLKKALSLKARDTVGMRLRADGRVEMWKVADGMAQRAQDKTAEAARKAAVDTMQSAAAAGLAAGRPAATPPPPSASRPSSGGKPGGGGGGLQQQRVFDPKAAAVSPVQHRQQQLAASCHAAAAAHQRQQLQQPAGQRPAAGPAAGTAGQQQRPPGQRAGAPVAMAVRPQQQRPPGQHVGPSAVTPVRPQQLPQQVAGQRPGSASVAEAVASQQQATEQRFAVALQPSQHQPVHSSTKAAAFAHAPGPRSAPHISQMAQSAEAGGAPSNRSRPVAAAAGGDGRPASAMTATGSSGRPAVGPAAGTAAAGAQRSAGSASTISEGRDASPEPAISL